MLPLRWTTRFAPISVVTRDQLARPSTEQLRLRAAESDAIAQLLHLPADCFFGECRLVEVGPSGDVVVPL